MDGSQLLESWPRQGRLEGGAAGPSQLRGRPLKIGPQHTSRLVRRPLSHPRDGHPTCTRRFLDQWV